MQYEYLKPLQNELLDILMFFDGVCKKIGVSYFLIAGSLLGAYRHNGFIPWDDDIDVGMVRSDYSRLIDYYKENGSDLFKLYCSGLDDKCHLIFSKFVDLRKERKEFSEQFDECENLSIDVFPYDECGNISHLKVKARFYHIRYLKFIIQSKDKLADKNYHESGFKRILRILFSSIKINEDYQILLEKVDLLGNRHDLGCGNYMCMCGKYKYGKEVINSKDLFPLTAKAFETESFSVPCNSEIVLLTTYGSNWDRIPPEKKRIQHARQSHP